MVTRIYKLICLKSTTPEELFARKIDGEEYGEALALAKSYGLDCDLVYQRQWRKSDVSVASIQDYLSKISKRSWVLHECLERVPESVVAMQELLQYGLRGTDLPALISIGNGEDGGRFIQCDPDDGLFEDMSFDEFNPEDQQRKEEMRIERKKQLLSQVDFQNLNLEQKEVCRARLKLISYMDRLNTYEYILGGRCAAVDRFDSKFFKDFRWRNIVETAVNYAQMSDTDALTTLFTYHGGDILSHRLAVLSNLPETTLPTDYKSLLPEMANADEVQSWEECNWRDRDWVEEDACRLAVGMVGGDVGAFLYEDRPDIEKYRCLKITKELLRDWYIDRACEIELYSRLVDNSLELLKIGIQNRVEGLYELLDDLLTMEMLVYECNVEASLTFQQLQKMADYDKLELIMSKSSEEMYVKNLRRWMVPFLRQCDRNNPGSYVSLLHDYVITKSKADLSLVVKLFETSKHGVKQPLVEDSSHLMSLALETVYVCERDDQLDMAISIAQCLPLKSQNDSPDLVQLHKDVDKLENHLSAMKILNANNIKKPIYYIRDTEADCEASRLLMVKLTRLAARRIPAPIDLQWRQLHDDIMELQNKVYRCLSADECHELFVEGLLCSSNMETIKLAGEMIHRSQNAKPSRQTLQRKVVYERAVELVLTSAQEYFNSSANLMDSCMDLARSCLNLIMDTSGAIQEELDLIASLALLDDFGVSVLPLQVRLGSDRLCLLEEAVAKRPSAYKQSQKLLRLGHLLRIPGSCQAERDPQVWKIIGEAAIKVGDVEFAAVCCDHLMSHGHADSWTLCVDLAEQDEFNSLSTKVDLLSFAVTYCTPDMIEPILHAKCLLERQLLIESLNGKIAIDDESSHISPFSPEATIKQTRKLLTSTTKTTKAVLNTMSNGQWWKDAIHALKQPRHRPVSEVVDDGNARFKKQGCHPFYASVLEECYTNTSAANYKTGEVTVSADDKIWLKMLRAAKLEEMLTEGEETQPATDVLIELALSTLPKDTNLGLSYLLALSDPRDAEKCFEELPSTDISIQLALYYYALQVYSHLKPCDKPLPYGLYEVDPTKVIHKVVRHVTTKPDVDWPVEVLELLPKLEKYRSMLDDYNQAMTLKRLGRGVDVIRFADDPEYKEETILGLAMSCESEVYNMAVSLAERYGLPLWDVYMSHLEYLFTDSGMATADVENRINQLKILKELTSLSDKFCDRMYTYVFPTIDGTDHGRLLYFFQLLEGYDTGRIQGQSPDVHIKLIRKIRPAAPGLDYRLLMEGKTTPLEVLQPVLTANNITTMAKLASKIPDGRGGFLQSSVVYSAWASNLFWKSGRLPDTYSGWITRYESCSDFLQKMQPEDSVHFIDSIAFVADSRKLLDMNCRQEIVRRALRYCRQQSTSKKKKQEGGDKTSWLDAATLLQQRFDHLDNVASDTVQSFSQADNPRYRKYADLFDRSCGDTEMIQNLLVTMLVDGETPDLVDDVLQVASLGSWNVLAAVQQAVRLLMDNLRVSGTTDDLVDKDIISLLETIIVNAQEHESCGGDLIAAEDILSLLRPFCSDSSMQTKPRLDVLQLLEKSFDLSDEDTTLLTYYRTEAIVTSAWEREKVVEDDVVTDASRCELFSRLLSVCSNAGQFVALCRLLQLWPQLESMKEGVEPVKNVWVQVFKAMLSSLGVDGGPLINSTVADACEGNPLDIACSTEVFNSLVNSHQPIEGVRFLLQSGHETLLPVAMETLSTQTEVVTDEDLLSNIFKNRLVSSVVNTCHYQSLIEYMLEKQGEDRPDWLDPTDVANQLSGCGFMAEAGSLMLRAKSSHSVLHTFGAAFGLIGRWFHRS